MRPRYKDAADKRQSSKASDEEDEDEDEESYLLYQKLPRRRCALPFTIMLGCSRKWMILVAVIWVQAFTGTNFDFSAYSSDLKSVLGISQVQLNYLATASDLGKAFGWSSGFALLYFPLSAVLLAAAFMGFVGYGVQWLVITNVVTFPYFLVFLCCVLAGLSICWFNTVCFILCIRNFPSNRSLALSLTVSFNGISAALYTVAYNAINPSSPNLYLQLNSFVPLIISVLSLIPIHAKPSSSDLFSPDEDSLVFLLLNVLAVLTSFYLLLFCSSTYFGISAQLHLAGAVFLLVFPLFIPGLVCARDHFPRALYPLSHLDGSGYVAVNVDDPQIHKGLLPHGTNYDRKISQISMNRVKGQNIVIEENTKMVIKDRVVMLGEEHSLVILVSRLDFWLYYIAYFGGGTIGLVYSNNLGQIAQSLNQSSNTTTLVTLYSSFSFFGRLLSAAPDYLRRKLRFARTGWLAIALIPTPIALFALASSSEPSTLQAATALIGLSSGFIFAAAVSISSDLFGPSSLGVNHNILITNIPIGSLVYGYLAASIYDSNAVPGLRSVVSDSVVCMGRQCYFWTFVCWGCLSVVGLVSSFFLFFRTRSVYSRLDQEHVSTILC